VHGASFIVLFFTIFELVFAILQSLPIGASQSHQLDHPFSSDLTTRSRRT